MIDRFHHVLIAPKDYDASMDFYQRVLGWSVSREWGGKGMPRGAILSGGGMKVVISDGGPGMPFEASKPHVHLDIHDIDARFRSLPEGTHVVMEPQDSPWGTRWFVVRDPDGNLIAFEEVHRRG